MSKARNSLLVGKEMTHRSIGRCVVDSAVKGSFSMVNITVLDRGAGWNDITQRYDGVKMTIKDSLGRVLASYWHRGENRDYGKQFRVHVNSLKSIEQ